MIKYLLIAAALIFISAAFYCPLIVRSYIVKTKKLRGHIRVVQISDLHCTLFGRGQSRLLNKINALNPDIICFTGDIFDERMPHESAYALLRGLTQYQRYFVCGNHEIYTDDMESILCKLKKSGVKILDGSGEQIIIRDSSLYICGVFDPIREQREPAEYIGPTFARRLKSCKSGGGDNFTLLLSHRPELIEQYEANSFDLVLCGHAHGGQWRLPPIINGVYAPHQGLFPHYAGGIYRKGKTTEIVSRGLSKILLVPRIFNPVEIVSVDITCE